MGDFNKVEFQQIICRLYDEEVIDNETFEALSNLVPLIDDTGQIHISQAIIMCICHK